MGGLVGFAVCCCVWYGCRMCCLARQAAGGDVCRIWAKQVVIRVLGFFWFALTNTVCVESL